MPVPEPNCPPCPSGHHCERGRTDEWCPEFTRLGLISLRDRVELVDPPADPLARAVFGPCWVIGYRESKGYRWISIGGRNRRAHRAALALAGRPVPDGLQVDHLCRNRSCCNPAHVEAVTPGENTRRGANARVTHCAQGHEFTPENTIITRTRGNRACRLCQNAACRAWRLRRKQATA